MTQPYTDTEIVARAIAARTTPGYWDAHHHADLLAEIATSALSAAGRLLPAGGETRTEWGVRLTWDDGRAEDPEVPMTLADAQVRVDYHHRQKVEQADVGRVWLVTPSLMQRQVWVGPWLPVPEEGTDRES